MKKLFYVLVFLLLIINVQGQIQTRMDIALRYLEQNAKTMGLDKKDYDDMLLTFQTTDGNGITYIYFNQTIEGQPIKNALLNFTIDKSGKVAFVANTFVSQKMAKLTSNKNKLTPEEAYTAAAKELGYTGFKSPSISVRDDKKITFNKSRICDNEVTAELKYDFKDEKLIPVWELNMDMAENSDFWQMRINSADGSFVSKNNLTVYCQHHHGKFAKHTNCEAHTMEIAESKAQKVEDILQGNASYRVYALPGESPIHTSHQLVVNPHFPEVSPYGWHDTDGKDGAEFTITRGNNVSAYTDKDDNDDVDADQPQPDGGANLTFDFPHDKLKEPLLNPNAAQTNLFYMVNMMHDISALYGFDEQWRNFQATNYTGKGAGNDYVLAQAFDGFKLATPKTDNANFSTPPDGGNGRMQMFLWTSPAGGVRIDKPDEIKGFITAFGRGSFGVPIPLATEPAISGPVVIAKDSDLSNPTACCKPIKDDLTGKIALIDRGLCDFSKKAKLAEDKGAIAVIICNIAGVNGGTGEEILSMGVGTTGISPDNIPSIFFKKSDCDRIRLQLNKEIEVIVTLQEAVSAGPKYIDGAFDNGVIAHEFGHGISNRLTGNGSSCLTNEEQMGEGWSDFFGLVTTVEPGDKGSDSRGIGTYAQGETINGPGIRRFPYSTDMTINPQTFDDIKGNKSTAGVVEPHAVGEIWTDCLWDLYWALVDKYGYDANWRNFESGNAKTLKIVIQAMKIQGCNPGYIRGRNAILSADSILYGGVNGYTIWDVFARRGLGFYADGGNGNNINDGTENFDTNPYKIALLKIKKEDIPLVKPDTEFEVKLETVSHLTGTQKGVTITDEIPPTFTYVNNSSNFPATFTNTNVKVQLGDVAFNQVNTVKYKIKAGPEGSKSLKISSFEGFDPEWEIELLEGTSSFSQSDLAWKSGNEAYYIYNEDTQVDQVLISPVYKVVGQNPALRFWHRFDTEVGTDGGFLEISTDGGNVWSTIRDGFIKNGYNSEISYSTFAIPSLNGFSGTSNGQFIDSYLDLSPWKGQDIKIRFRFGSNASASSTALLKGWFIDDVEMMDLLVYETTACVANQDNANGSCSLLRKIIIDSKDKTATDDLTNIDSYKVYPNPAHDYIIIDINAKNTSNVVLTLSGVDGKRVYNKNVKINTGRNSESIITNELNPGVYLLQIKDSNTTVTQKIIIH
jgi:extracellular elastinolytic metalloproteinase